MNACMFAGRIAFNRPLPAPNFALAWGAVALEPQVINGTVTTPQKEVPAGAVFARSSLVITDEEWATPGYTITIRAYEWIGGVRTFIGGGTTSSGPSTVKGAAVPRGAMPDIGGLVQGTGIELEIEQTGGIKAGANVQF